MSAIPRYSPRDRRIRPALFLLAGSLALAACSGKAIEEGTCTDDDDANFAMCIEAGCSAYKSTEATGNSSCEGSLDVIAQSGSGSCSFGGSGECEVICSCSGGEEDSSGGADASGDTSGGSDTSGDTSGGSDTSGDTSGGDSSGGDTSGGDTSGGDSSGGDSSGGDSSGGDSSGDSSGGDSSGDSSGGSSAGSDSSGDGGSTGETSLDEKCDAICDDLWPCIWGELYDTVDCATCDTWSGELIECLYGCEDSCDCAEADCGMTVLGD